MPKTDKQKTSRTKKKPPSKDRPQPETTTELAFDPVLLDKLIRGQISLADFQGISKKQQYNIAKVGYTLLEQGKLDRAERIFRGLVALEPYDDYFHTVMASIFHQRGDLELARQGYSIAIQINPRSVNALANRAEILHARGMHYEAYQDLCRVMELDPSQQQPVTRRSRSIYETLASQADKLKPTAPPKQPSPSSKGGKAKTKQAKKKKKKKAPPRKGAKPAK